MASGLRASPRSISARPLNGSAAPGADSCFLSDLPARGDQRRIIECGQRTRIFSSDPALFGLQAFHQCNPE